jgi:penicillin-binding protein 2
MRSRSTSSGNDRRERAWVLLGIGLLVFLVLVGRLFFLQVVTSGRSRELAERNWLRPEFVPGPRGRILDRNGVVLAEMTPSFAIGIDPQFELFHKNRELMHETVERLARLCDQDPVKFEEQIDREKKTSYNPVRLVRNADSLMVARVAEHMISLPGVSVMVEPTRRYPADTLAAHVLGYVGEVGEKDLEKLTERGYHTGSLIGKSGIELQYEELLRGEDGKRYVEVNALGRRSEAFNRREPVPTRPGRDLELTLDAKVQRATERALDAAGYEGPEPAPEIRGAAILMDVWTGEILAMASRPGFDDNIFSSSLNQEEWKALMTEGRPLLNRAIQAAYPPGSTLKPITEYGALAAGVIRPGQYESPCLGGQRFGNRVFHCWKHGGHGSLDDLGALAQSCDVYFYQLAPSLGVDGIAKVARQFGLAEKTGIDLPQERGSLIPTSEYYDERFGKRQWSPGLALNLIIGQGEIQVTPIQLLRATAMIATGGREVTPRLLRAMGPEERQHRYAEPKLGAVTEDVKLNAMALERVRLGMRMAVDSGTAKSARVHGIPVAGKTGTAENPGYDHALFAAYAPADHPRVAAVVLLENRGHGGAVAAPVARRIFDAFFGIPDSLVVQTVDSD